MLRRSISALISTKPGSRCASARSSHRKCAIGLAKIGVRARDLNGAAISMLADEFAECDFCFIATSRRGLDNRQAEHPQHLVALSVKHAPRIVGASACQRHHAKPVPGEFAAGVQFQRFVERDFALVDSPTKRHRNPSTRCAGTLRGSSVTARRSSATDSSWRPMQAATTAAIRSTSELPGVAPARAGTTRRRRPNRGRWPYARTQVRRGLRQDQAPMQRLLRRHSRDSNDSAYGAHAYAAWSA